MTLPSRQDSDPNVAGRLPESTRRSKGKSLISSLRRLLGRSSSQLRCSSNAAPLRPASGPQDALVLAQEMPVPNLTGITKASPRPATSLPMLLPELSQGAGRSGLWPFAKLPLSHSSARKLAQAPSMSSLSSVPSVDRCAPPFSTGAVADNVSAPGSDHIASVGPFKHRRSCEDAPAPTACRVESPGAAMSMTTSPRDRQELPHGWSSSPPVNFMYGRPLPALTAASLPPTSCPDVPGSATFRGDSAAAMAAEGPTGAEGNRSTLLVVCAASPEAMRRPVWRLADYVIGGRIYRGEVSSVYKAVCNHSGLKVVLKVYSLGRVADNALHTLVREVRIHTDLAHDNILAMYGVFEEENRLILVLERAARGDLLAVRSTVPGCRMSEDQLRVLVLAPLLEAMVYLHGRGVCHRDIKPENLLMTGNWQLRLADFGAAINLTQERAVTRTGTLEYMAPEVERCPLKMLPEDNKDNRELAYTTAADVWSVGVLAYEMLVGFPPFIDCRNNLGQQEMQFKIEDAGVDVGGGAGSSDGSARRELHFPHFVSAGGQDFISVALAERPGDRPTAAQLLQHPWLKHAVRQHHARQQQAAAAEAQPQQQQAQAQQQTQQLPAAEGGSCRFIRVSRQDPREGPSRLHLSSGHT